MSEPLECLSCYEEFEQRDDAPDLRCCVWCVPNPRDIDETRCPKCGWDSTSIACDEDAPVEIKNRRPDWELGYCGGEHWDEHWTCPECGTQFSYDNSSV